MAFGKAGGFRVCLLPQLFILQPKAVSFTKTKKLHKNLNLFVEIEDFLIILEKYEQEFKINRFGRLRRYDAGRIFTHERGC